jgi:hypothetical protein
MATAGTNQRGLHTFLFRLPNSELIISFSMASIEIIIPQYASY